jgi:hypothetical protein
MKHVSIGTMRIAFGGLLSEIATHYLYFSGGYMLVARIV